MHLEGGAESDPPTKDTDNCFSIVVVFFAEIEFVSSFVFLNNYYYYLLLFHILSMNGDMDNSFETRRGRNMQ